MEAGALSDLRDDRPRAQAADRPRSQTQTLGFVSSGFPIGLRSCIPSWLPFHLQERGQFGGWASRIDHEVPRRALAANVVKASIWKKHHQPGRSRGSNRNSEDKIDQALSQTPSPVRRVIEPNGKKDDYDRIR
jgi:hypothetical protein